MSIDIILLGKSIIYEDDNFILYKKIFDFLKFREL